MNIYNKMVMLMYTSPMEISRGVNSSLMRNVRNIHEQYNNIGQNRNGNSLVWFRFLIRIK